MTLVGNGARVLPPSVLIAVALGGGTGALFRVAVGGGLLTLFPTAFPWGTLAVNLGGSFLLGFLAVWLPVELGQESARQGEHGSASSPALRALAIPGFCGGFTTFSAFSVETLLLVEAGRGALAVLYVGVSVALCIVGVVAGGLLGRRGVQSVGD